MKTLCARLVLVAVSFLAYACGAAQTTEPSAQELKQLARLTRVVDKFIKHETSTLKPCMQQLTKSAAARQSAINAEFEVFNAQCVKNASAKDEQACHVKFVGVLQMCLEGAKSLAEEALQVYSATKQSLPLFLSVVKASGAATNNKTMSHAGKNMTVSLMTRAVNAAELQRSTHPAVLLDNLSLALSARNEEVLQWPDAIQELQKMQDVLQEAIEAFAKNPSVLPSSLINQTTYL